PLEGVGLLLAIEPIVDMGRTALNVSGQALIPAIVAKRHDILDVERYDGQRVLGYVPVAEDADADETPAEDAGADAPRAEGTAADAPRAEGTAADAPRAEGTAADAPRAEGAGVGAGRDSH